MQQSQPVVVDLTKPAQMIVGGGATLGDGPSRQDPQPIVSAVVDMRALEIECKRIVQEISERFIDLGLEDNEEDYAAE